MATSSASAAAPPRANNRLHALRVRMKLRRSSSVGSRTLRRFLIIASVAAIFLFCFFPFKTTVVPEWKIRVVDESGEPFTDARVFQSWYHYSYDVSDGEERYVDQNGYVTFPERTFRAPLLYRVLRSALAQLLTLAHGSTGIHAYVWAVTPERTSAFFYYKPGEPLPKTIVLRR